MERKTNIEYKAIDDRVVTGFSSIIGNVDDGGDLILPGAYRKTLKERAQRLRYLWQHDSSQPPTAKILEIREAGRDELPQEVIAAYPEAEGGLLVKREYLDTPRGNEVLAGIKAGAIGEMSIGYDALQADYPKPDSPLVVGGKVVRRKLKEIRLWECSDVLWGMNAATANLKAFMDLDALSTEELAVQLEQAGRLDELAQMLRERDEAARSKAFVETMRAAIAQGEVMAMRQRQVEVRFRQLAMSR